jgi:hypothetical protein
MADNNKLSASSEYPSDVSTELNVSASLSNNESSGSNVRDSVTSITTANPQSSTPDLKNVQDLTRYVNTLQCLRKCNLFVNLYHFLSELCRLNFFCSKCKKDFKLFRIKCFQEISFLTKLIKFSF